MKGFVTFTIKEGKVKQVGDHATFLGFEERKQYVHDDQDLIVSYDVSPIVQHVFVDEQGNSIQEQSTPQPVQQLTTEEQAVTQQKGLLERFINFLKRLFGGA